MGTKANHAKDGENQHTFENDERSLMHQPQAKPKNLLLASEPRQQNENGQALQGKKQKLEECLLAGLSG